MDAIAIFPDNMNYRELPDGARYFKKDNKDNKSRVEL